MAVKDRDYFRCSPESELRDIDLHMSGMFRKGGFGTALIENKSSKDNVTHTEDYGCIAYLGNEKPCIKAREELSPRLKDLSDYIGSDIVFVTCHASRNQVPRNVDDRMHIFCQMTPPWVDFKLIKIDSYTIEGRTYVLPPGQQDYLEPLVDEIEGCDGIYDDHGHLMALMVGYNIYILNDMIHCSNPEGVDCAMKVYEHIINECVKLWNECEEINKEEV